jgi:hypothetical protein
MTPLGLVQLIDAKDVAIDGSIIPRKPYDFVASQDPYLCGFDHTGWLG